MKMKAKENVKNEEINNHSEKGFTLIELLVVIAVATIVVGIVAR